MIYYLIIGVVLHILLFMGKPFRYHLVMAIRNTGEDEFGMLALMIFALLMGLFASLWAWPLTVPALSIATVLKRQDYIDYLNGKEETE